MKKILPVHKPYISHTPESSFLFSILQGIPTSEEWICTKLLSMVVRKENVHDEFSMIGNFFSECPFFHIVNVKEEIINSILSLSFSDCIEKAIKSGYYVSAMVNTKNINNYIQDIDFLHHIHVFGYDTDKQAVHIADHFRKGYFTFEECSFLEINQSRNGVNSDIAFVKVLPDVRFDLTIEKMIQLIREHMNGVNLFAEYRILNAIYPNDLVDSCSFGLKYYDCLIDIIQGGRFPYNRPIVLIYEHVKILKILLAIIDKKFQINIEQMYLQWKDLLINAELLKNYYMKVQISNHFNELDYNIIKNSEQISKITGLLLSVKEKEKLLLEKILMNLNA